MTRINPTEIPDAPGTYVLILRSEITRTIQVGRMGTLTIQPGFYLYTGSALGPGGLRARVSRHFRGSEKLHWHIDYLRQYADPVAAWLAPDALRREHQWADALSRWKSLEPMMPGFGASDCGCVTHLFISAAQPAFGAFQAQLEWCGYPAAELFNTRTADHAGCAATRARLPQAHDNQRFRPKSAGPR
jgi:Uri superfamily endonuclease